MPDHLRARPRQHPRQLASGQDQALGNIVAGGVVCPALAQPNRSWSSFFTAATARLAVNRSRDPGATDSGPSSASLRNDRISSLASLHRVRRGWMFHPGAASCSSFNRNRSQITAAGWPH